MGSDRAKGNNQGGVTGRVTPKRRGVTGAPANRHPLSSHSAVLLACPPLCYAQSLREWGHFSSLLSHKLSLSRSHVEAFSSLSSHFWLPFRYQCLCLSSLCFSWWRDIKRISCWMSGTHSSFSFCLSFPPLFFFLPLLPISDVWRLTQCVLCVSVCLYGENECACLCACLVFVRDHG